jgi:hypothetical protein
LLILPVLIVWGIKDKNFKFKYIGKESHLSKDYWKLSITREEKRLVAIVLYFIGVHKVFARYKQDGLYTNINIFEYACKYREEKLRTFQWSTSQ